MWRGAWCLVVVAVAGCDPPAYDLTLSYFVADADGLTFTADGLPVDVTGTPQQRVVEIEGHYDSYRAAREAPEIALEVWRDEAIAWTHSEAPNVCDGEDRCGDIVSASYALCFDGGGQPLGLCGSLTCADEHGGCGGWISVGGTLSLGQSAELTSSLDRDVIFSNSSARRQFRITPNGPFDSNKLRR